MRFLKNLFTIFLVLGLLSGVLTGTGCRGKLKAEIESLKAELINMQEENLKLRKQVELLSNAIKELSEANSISLGMSNETRTALEKAKEVKKPE